MTKPNLIQSLLWRTKKREQAKKEYDGLLDLSAKSEKLPTLELATMAVDNGAVRLLDEGTVVDAEGYPCFYIKKGAIEGYYDELSADYVGSVNVGHNDFATFPFLVGEWTKEDLTVVDIGDGRKGLDVHLKLYEDSVFIQELKNRDYPIGVSAEFSYTLDADSSEEYQVPIIETITIQDFAIVGDAGNVGSSNIQLNAKEHNDMSKKEKQSLFEKFFTKYEKEATQTKEETQENQESKETEDTQETKETTEEETTKSSETVTEETAELTEDEQLDKAATIIEEMGQEQEKALTVMEAMEQKIATLKAENTSLKEHNAQLSTATNKGLSHFEEVVRNMDLDAKLSVEKHTEDQPVITDGFGEG